MNVHVTPSGNGWSVRTTGAKKAWRVFEDRAEAIRAAVRMKKAMGRIYLHDSTGRIVSRQWLPAIKR